ncbi:ubiquitin-conjugating enzyme/RWD-like protein [Lipomyces kononenkoae]|uniref:Ubiquitin-conjugating enzyme/RWD-like protein n=1 Tax=Lipomyces kononenkoae TaxID=34357 RepID=A0ACC3T0Z3_LIPKO
MATRAANKRLAREYKHMQESPPPFITAHPSEKNILIWHYLITGPPSTPYEGGQYHGTLTFPPDYPYKPPAIRMITPSGRFQTNTRLCLSISDYHPKTWNPAWSVSTILTGLLSFMTSDELTTGALRSTNEEKIKLAELSHEWNLRQNRKFVEEFPAEASANEKYIVERRRKIRSAATTPAVAAAVAALADGVLNGNGGADGRPRESAGGGEGAGGGRGQLGVFDTSGLRPGTGKTGAGGANVPRANQSWIGTHKALCAVLLVLACVIANRVANYSSSK